MEGMKKFVQRIVKRLGFDIIRFEPNSHPLARRKKILETYKINQVLDVGANIGQYGLQLREIGYTGRIVSFEPQTAAYSVLREVAQADAMWEIYNFALGDKEETALINIAGNSFSSSLLDMLPKHIKSAPESEYTGQEEITVKTLDSIFASLCNQTDNVYLKMDTQGFEKNVLEGAKSALSSIATIQLEMSLTPLYEGELLFPDMYQLLNSKGYNLIAVEPGFVDEDTGQLLQLDGIFHRA